MFFFIYENHGEHDSQDIQKKKRYIYTNKNYYYQQKTGLS